jgi:hypothetical protein
MPRRTSPTIGDRVNYVHVKDVSASAVAKGQADGLNYAETVLAGVWIEPGLGDLDLQASSIRFGRGVRGLAGGRGRPTEPAHVGREHRRIRPVVPERTPI